MNAVQKWLVVGQLPALMADFLKRLDLPGVEVVGAVGADEVRAALAEDVDHVVLGGGLDLGARLEMIRVIFESSDRATVHLKDHLSGPEGFVPFVRAVAGGLAEYRPRPSPNAVLHADRPAR